MVADEVRKLAGNTQQAVQNTQELIEKIRHSSANAVNAINQSQQLTHQAVGEADLAEEALGSIYQAISTINDMTYQIASAAEEQSSVSRPSPATCQNQRTGQRHRTGCDRNGQSQSGVAPGSRAFTAITGTISSQLIIFHLRTLPSGRVRLP